MKSGTKISSHLRSEKPGRGGFTLVELMIAMALGLIVLGAMYSVFTIQNKHFSNQEQIVEMQQNARMAIEIIGREIRMAGYNPQRTTGSFTFLLAATENRATNQNNIAFTYDDNSDGIENSNDSEQVAFRVEGGVLKRFSTGNFTYTLNDNTVVQNPNATQVLKIVKVKISVTAKAAKADPTYTDLTHNDHYRRYTLTTSVTPRNL
jgi:type IV pilus assembly protein PilW